VVVYDQLMYIEIFRSSVKVTFTFNANFLIYKSICLLIDKINIAYSL